MGTSGRGQIQGRTDPGQVGAHRMMVGATWMTVWTGIVVGGEQHHPEITEGWSRHE